METKNITAIEDDKTFGNRNLEFKKLTIGNSKTAIKKAIKTGISTLLPIYRIYVMPIKLTSIKASLT